MTGPRTENDLEVTMRSVRSGELPSERLAPALLQAELVVLVDGTPDPTAIQPLVVHRNDENFLAVFTATDQVPAEFGEGRSALLMPGRLLVSGAAPEVGLVVNPRSAGEMEIPPAALAVLRQASTTPSTRYFIREQTVEGQVVPVSVFRRRFTPKVPIDERWGAPSSRRKAPHWRTSCHASAPSTASPRGTRSSDRKSPPLLRPGTPHRRSTRPGATVPEAPDQDGAGGRDARRGRHLASGHERRPRPRHSFSPRFRPRGDLDSGRARDLRHGRATRVHPADPPVSR